MSNDKSRRAQVYSKFIAALPETPAKTAVVSKAESLGVVLPEKPVETTKKVVVYQDTSTGSAASQMRQRAMQLERSGVDIDKLTKEQAIYIQTGKMIGPAAQYLPPPVYGKTITMQPQAGVEPIKEIEPTEYYAQFGYKPEDPDYSKIYSSIEAEKQYATDLHSQAVTTYTQGNTLINEQRENLKKIQASASGTMWEVDGVQHTREDAIKLMEENISRNVESVKKAKESFTEIDEYFIALMEQEAEVRAREAGGWYVDITSKGYEFKQPTAKEVHEEIYGKGLSESRYAAKQVMTWGIPLTISAGATFGKSVLDLFGPVGKVIGEKVVPGDPLKAHEEEEYRRLLELSQKPGEEFGSYTGRFWTSGEAIESVYLPLVTMGIGQVYTGIKAGAMGTAKIATRLTSYGAKHSTKVVTRMHHVMKGAGAVGVAISGYTIGATAVTRPEMLPSTIGRVGFGWGIAAAGFKSGQYLYERAVPTGYQVYGKGAGPEITKVRSIKHILAEKYPGREGVQRFYTPEGAEGAVSYRMQSGEIMIGKTRYSGQVYQPPGSEIAITYGKYSTEMPLKGGWRSTQFQKQIGYATPVAKAGKTVGYYEMGAFYDMATGRITPSQAYAVTRPTGQKFDFKVGEPIAIEKEVKDVFGRPKMKEIGKMYTKEAPFTEYETLTYGEYLGGKDWAYKDVVARGADYTRTYLKTSTGKPISVTSKLVPKVKGIKPGKEFTTPAASDIVTVKPSKIVTWSKEGPVVISKTGEGVVGVSIAEAKPLPIVMPKTGVVTATLTSPSVVSIGKPSVIGVGRIGVGREPSVISVERVMGMERRDVLSLAESKVDMIYQRPLVVQQHLEARTQVPVTSTERISFESIVPSLALEEMSKTERYKPIVTSQLELIKTTDYQELISRQEPVLVEGLVLNQELLQEQLTGQALLEELVLEEPFLIEPVVTPPPPPGIMVPLPVTARPPPPLGKPQVYGWGGKVGTGIGMTDIKRGRGKRKSILADILSVTRSQALYGTATHPRPTRSAFRKGRSSLFMHVPTVEIEERGLTKRGIFGNIFGNKRRDKIDLI